VRLTAAARGQTLSISALAKIANLLFAPRLLVAAAVLLDAKPGGLARLGPAAASRWSSNGV